MVPCGDALINGVLKQVFVPRNVALLMFNRFPQQYFPAAKIKVTQETRDDREILKEFTGPLQSQIKKCIDYVHSTTNNKYPREAVRETIVNAVYHRGYEPEDSGPTEVLILPNSLEIISFPGPPSNLKQEDFSSGSEIPVARVKNQRIGEFLSKLGLAKSCRTGVQKIFRAMKKNQNPNPKFDVDSGHYRVILPAHHKFQAENVCMLYHMLYHHEWKLEKLEIVWKHDARRVECFHTMSNFSNFHGVLIFNSYSTNSSRILDIYDESD